MMGCKEFESHVALHAGGDLPEKDIARLESHLARCTDCSRMMLEMKENLDSLAQWHKEIPEERELEELRRGVMTSIAAGAVHESVIDRFRITFFSGGIRLAAALALSIAVIMVVWFVVLHSTAPVEIANTGSPERSNAIAAAQAPAATGLPPRVGPARRSDPLTAVSKSHETSAFPVPAKSRARVSKQPAEKLLRNPVLERIELQTADPNIRIIWLVGPRPREREANDASPG